MSTVWTYSQQTKAQFELHQLVESKKTREELEIIGITDFDSKAPASITLIKPITAPDTPTSALVATTAMSPNMTS
jgi:hypothetical protein